MTILGRDGDLVGDARPAAPARFSRKLFAVQLVVEQLPTLLQGRPLQAGTSHRRHGFLVLSFGLLEERSRNSAA